MKTYHVDAAPVLVERAWSKLRKTPSLPGDRWPGEIHGAMRRFRDFLDGPVFGGAKDVPTLADPAVPRRRTPHG